MVRLFENEATASLRAQQVCQILISLAHNRQSTTYGKLAELLGYAGAGVFAGILGHIMNWCDQNKLPPLTILVVNQETGLPGAGLVTIEDLAKDRERVFRERWFDIIPPTAKELAEAQVAGIR